VSRALIGLIGANIMQSLSPALHEDAFAAAGIVGHYHLMDVEVLKGRGLHDLLQAVRTAGFLGANVTHPFKEEIIALLDEVSVEAAQIGAVNTVAIDPNGRTTGYNTDRVGFGRAFLEMLGPESVGEKVVVLLGAGGAGRAVAFALTDLGAASVLVHDTEQARATALCASLTVRFGDGRCRVATDPAAALAQAAGLVNATPVGMLGYPGMPVEADLIREAHWVADIIYTPLETALIKAARQKGCRTMTGAGMCVHQAAEAFRLLTGIAPDLARMRSVFDAAAAKRAAGTCGREPTVERTTSKGI
jgi:quinate/shikimate dehydrogenase (NAD+)